MELLLTISGLAVAIYALVPRDRRLDFKLRFPVWGWAFVLFAFTASIYVEFYDFFVGMNLALPRCPSWFGLTPEKLLYLAWLIFFAPLAFYMRFYGLSRRQIFKFRDLVLELFWTQSYAELFSLLDRNLTPLVKIYKNEPPFPRFRAWLTPPHEAYLLPISLPSEMSPLLTKTPSQVSRLRKFFDRLKRSIGGLITKTLPSNDEYQDAAQELIHGVFLSQQFSTALVQTKPYFGLKVIEEFSDINGVEDFVSQYIHEMLQNRHSLLYTDIKNNQNIGSGHRYVISPSNRFLSFFLSDVKVAERFAIYQPVGEYLLNYLKELAHNPKTDPYNVSARGSYDIDTLSEKAVWHDPLFVGVRFFDIMVSEALYQNINWHMWLSYYTFFTQQIVENYSLEDPTVDPHAEWPTPYSYILYQMISSMRGWIQALEVVPLDQENVVLESTTPNHENENIPKCAIIALCDCAKKILLSNEISETFKDYILDIVFRSYFNIKRNRDLDRYAELFRHSLHFGGYQMLGEDPQYRELIQQSLSRQHGEYLIKFSDEDVQELIEAL